MTAFGLGTKGTSFPPTKADAFLLEHVDIKYCSVGGMKRH